MANFITTSVSWSGKETLDYLITPMFQGGDPLLTAGIEVKTGVKDKELLNYFNPVAKMTKAATAGFTGATGATLTQRTLEVYKMKAEMETDGTVFYNTVFGQVQTPGNWNDLSSSEQSKLLLNIMTELFKLGFKSDIFRQFWLNDLYHEGLTSGVFNGVASTDYNAYNGVWKKIFGLASTTPTASQIKRVSVTDGAVAQVQTVTMSTDASGVGTITIGGKGYTSTRDTDATTTFNAFRTANLADCALRGYALTGTATLIVTATVVGAPFAAITFTSVSGTYACTIAATTANTPPAALAAAEAHGILNSLWVGASKELASVPKGDKLFYVGDLVYENLIAYLESTSYAVQGYTNLVDGLNNLQYRGVSIVNVGWDYHLDADFPHATGYLWAYPHRVIYAAKNNLILGIDGTNEFNSFDFWFNKDLEMNRWRAKIIMGPEIKHYKYIAVAY